MENSRNFYNHEINGDESDNDSSSSEKKKKTAKKPIVLEGILFNRAEELGGDKKDAKKSEQSTDAVIEEILKPEREITSEIVEERQAEVVEDLASAEKGSAEALVVEADQELLDNIEDRLEQASAEGSPIAAELVEETIDAAYVETVEELADQPPIMDQARHDMDEAYSEYWAPDFGAKPNYEAQQAFTNGAEVSIGHEFIAPVDLSPDLTPKTPAYSAKKPSIFSTFAGYAAGGFNRLKEVDIPQPTKAKERLKKTVNSLRSSVVSREAQIRDLQREKYQAPVPETELDKEVAAPIIEALAMPTPINYERAKHPEKPEKLEAKPARAENLTKEQLIRLAESIRVEGITVRSMFEVHRFDEKSLRRIVSEYLRSGNVSKVVFEEVERHDKSRYSRFETLNQMKPTILASAYDHKTLPKPVKTFEDDVQAADQSKPAAASTKPLNKSPKPMIEADGSGLAEKIILSAVFVFIFVALVMLFMTIMSHN